VSLECLYDAKDAWRGKPVGAARHHAFAYNPYPQPAVIRGVEENGTKPTGKDATRVEIPIKMGYSSVRV